MLPSCDQDAEPERTTYIHSKLMIVDDRFLTVGSANLTNRSMAVDTELNASFETAHDDKLADSIREIRAALLAEHTGLPDLDLSDGLVARLDKLADQARCKGPTCKLRRHPSPTDGEKTMLSFVDPDQLPFDPASVDEPDDEKSLFVRGIGSAFRHLFSNRDDTR